MFRAVLSDPEILKTSFNALSHVIDELNIKIDEDGLVISVLSRDHALFAILNIVKDGFDEYIYNEPVTVNVDSDEVTNALKKLRADDTLTLEITKNHLILILDGESRRTFKIVLIDSEYEAPAPPELEYELNIDLPVKILKDGVDMAGMYNIDASVKVDEDKIYINAVGDFGESQNEYLHGERVNEMVESKYRVERLKTILRAEKFSKDVNLQIGNDMPLTVTYTDIFNSTLKFMLADVEEVEM